MAENECATTTSAGPAVSAIWSSVSEIHVVGSGRCAQSDGPVPRQGSAAE